MDRIPADGGCGWENADRKVRIRKKNADNKKSKRKKNEKCGWQKVIIIKQTKERNLSFKSLSHGWTLHLHTERDANS